MRLRVLIRTPKLPILYRHRIMALIKEALTRSNKFYKLNLYEDKDFTKKVKPFTFSVLLPKSRKAVKEAFYIDGEKQITDYVFHFPENSFLTLLISSNDLEFLLNLYNGLLEIKKFPFNNEITFVIERILPLEESEIDGEKVVLRTLSPILIEDKEERPVLKGNEFPFEEFNRELNSIQNRIFRDLRGEGLKRELIFTPLENGWKKSVVKHTLRGIREKMGRPYMTLTCFEGSFILEGDPEDLKLLYEIGIGLRTGQGFGMVEEVVG